MDYYKLTNDQLMKVLKERGIRCPSASVATNSDFAIAMLKQDDDKKKQDAAGGKSKLNTKADQTDIPLPQSSASSKQIPQNKSYPAMDYSKHTVDQIKKVLKERGVSFPSKARKADLIDMLEQDDTGKKQDVTGGNSKINTKADLPLPQSSAASKQGTPNDSAASAPSSKMEKTEGWLVQTEMKTHTDHYEPDTKIVGFYSSKEQAIKNAKIAFGNMDCFEDMGGWDAEDLEDNSENIEKRRDHDKGCKGGVLFKMGEDTGEGDTIAVSIYKCSVDKPIKPNGRDYNANDSFTEDESDYE